MAKLLAQARIDQGFATEVTLRHHRVRADLTPDKGGADSGPTPPELLLGALAACSAIFAKIFAQREGLSGPILVEAEAESPEPPTHVENFSVRVTIPGLSQEQAEKARAFVERCVVGQTLKMAHDVKLSIQP